MERERWVRYTNWRVEADRGRVSPARKLAPAADLRATLRTWAQMATETLFPFGDGFARPPRPLVPR
eukprot:9182316-Pyramimonas_sp.AAC.1